MLCCVTLGSHNLTLEMNPEPVKGWVESPMLAVAIQTDDVVIWVT